MEGGRGAGEARGQERTEEGVSGGVREGGEDWERRRLCPVPLPTLEGLRGTSREGGVGENEVEREGEAKRELVR